MERGFLLARTIWSLIMEGRSKLTSQLDLLRLAIYERKLRKFSRKLSEVINPPKIAQIEKGETN